MSDLKMEVWISKEADPFTGQRSRSLVRVDLPVDEDWANRTYDRFPVASGEEAQELLEQTSPAPNAREAL